MVRYFALRWMPQNPIDVKSTLVQCCVPLDIKPLSEQILTQIYGVISKNAAMYSILIPPYIYLCHSNCKPASIYPAGKWWFVESGMVTRISRLESEAQVYVHHCVIVTWGTAVGTNKLCQLYFGRQKCKCSAWCLSYIWKASNKHILTLHWPEYI